MSSIFNSASGQTIRVYRGVSTWFSGGWTISFCGNSLSMPPSVCGTLIWLSLTGSGNPNYITLKICRKGITHNEFYLFNVASFFLSSQHLVCGAHDHYFSRWCSHTQFMMSACRDKEAFCWTTRSNIITMWIQWENFSIMSLLVSIVKSDA